jgi:hypothetical protein
MSEVAGISVWRASGSPGGRGPKHVYALEGKGRAVACAVDFRVVATRADSITPRGAGIHSKCGRSASDQRNTTAPQLAGDPYNDTI